MNILDWVNNVIFNRLIQKEETYTPPKTRIKITTTGEGKERYTAQFLIDTPLCRWCEYVPAATLEEAQGHIDERLKYDKEQWEQRVVKTEYIKYP